MRVMFARPVLTGVLCLWFICAVVAASGLLARFSPLPAGAPLQPLCGGEGNTSHPLPPCVMDITPGETPADDALRILDVHPWVESFVRSRGMEQDSAIIRWSWSGLQPALIDSRREGQLWMQGGDVRWIEVGLNWRQGDLFLSAGAPQAGGLHTVSSRAVGGYVTSVYRDGSVVGRGQLSCPVRLWQFWHMPLTLRLNNALHAEAVLRSEDDTFSLPFWGRCLSSRPA